MSDYFIATPLIDACSTLTFSIRDDTITQGRREVGQVHACVPGSVIFGGSATNLDGTLSVPRWSRVTPMNKR
jgi:hypothetical protein